MRRPATNRETADHVARRWALEPIEKARLLIYLDGKRLARDYDRLSETVQAAVNDYDRIERERDAHENDAAHVVSDRCGFCRADGLVFVAVIR